MERLALASLELLAEQVRRNRSIVRARLMARLPNVDGGKLICLASADLRLLFDLYDNAVFQGTLGRQVGGRLGFSLSTRMTKSAGQLIFPRNLASLPPGEQWFEFRIGIDLFSSYQATDRPQVVNGIPAVDALEALQIVFEHELCHLIELVSFGKTSCHGRRFKAMARSIFGHTGTRHQLPTRRELAETQLGLKVGDQVWFSHHRTQVHGVIDRIHKRATVMVPDPGGDHRDGQGSRYRKWYVPLHLLKKR
ncbi:MAG: SprT-like domain-containing protein [Bacillota bacterium]